jgi:hypothetical protein
VFIVVSVYFVTDSVRKLLDTHSFSTGNRFLPFCATAWYSERVAEAVISRDAGATSNCFSHYKTSKVVPLRFLTEHHALKTYWGNGGIAPRILDLSIRWS